MALSRSFNGAGLLLAAEQLSSSVDFDHSVIPEFFRLVSACAHSTEQYCRQFERNSCVPTPGRAIQGGGQIYEWSAAVCGAPAAAARKQEALGMS